MQVDDPRIGAALRRTSRRQGERLPPVVHASAALGLAPLAGASVRWFRETHLDRAYGSLSVTPPRALPRRRLARDPRL